MNNYTRIGLEIGELVDRKNAAYGSSFAKAGEFLRLLWPNGLTPDRYDDALLMARIFDKQMRIATDRDAFGESPYRDIAGYGLLGAELHEQREGDAPCGSARADAETKPKATPASVPAPASPGTTTSERPQSERPSASTCSPLPESFLRNEVSKDAFVLSVMESAPSAEDGQRRHDTLIGFWLRHNTDTPMSCPECWQTLVMPDSYTVLVRRNAITIHQDCRLHFALRLWREGFPLSEVRI